MRRRGTPVVASVEVGIFRGGGHTVHRHATRDRKGSGEGVRVRNPVLIWALVVREGGTLA